MKLSNKKNVEVFLCLMIILFCLNMFIYTLIFLTNHHSMFVNIVAGSVLVFIVGIMVRVRQFEYTDSGSVISIKRFHPFSAAIKFPVAEFPAYMLTDFEVRNHLFVIELTLHLGNKKRNKILRYTVYGLSKDKLKSLERSLAEAVRSVDEMNLGQNQ